ncbi:hypothetical protein K438DRAFT_1988395 [Mycena galopus ATCC 62051]|nr:hypothetical protein K438DRAFT_1988395 [Mycena galopus ATCC 62051]
MSLRFRVSASESKSNFTGTSNIFLKIYRPTPHIARNSLLLVSHLDRIVRAAYCIKHEGPHAPLPTSSGAHLTAGKREWVYAAGALGGPGQSRCRHRGWGCARARVARTGRALLRCRVSRCRLHCLPPYFRHDHPDLRLSADEVFLSATPSPRRRARAIRVCCTPDELRNALQDSPCTGSVIFSDFSLAYDCDLFVNLGYPSSINIRDGPSSGASMRSLRSFRTTAPHPRWQLSALHGTDSWRVAVAWPSVVH